MNSWRYDRWPARLNLLTMCIQWYSQERISDFQPRTEVSFLIEGFTVILVLNHWRSYLENSLIDVDILDDEPHLDALGGFDAEVKPALLRLLVFDIRDGLENVLRSWMRYVKLVYLFDERNVAVLEVWADFYLAVVVDVEDVVVFLGGAVGTTRR